MAKSAFKVVAGASDWGSPLSEQPAFDTLEEARAAAREFVAESKRSGGPAALGKVVVEETRADGTVVTHPIG